MAWRLFKIRDFCNGLPVLLIAEEALMLIQLGGFYPLLATLSPLVAHLCDMLCWHMGETLAAFLTFLSGNCCAAAWRWPERGLYA